MLMHFKNFFYFYIFHFSDKMAGVVRLRTLVQGKANFHTMVIFYFI